MTLHLLLRLAACTTVVCVALSAAIAPVAFGDQGTGGAEDVPSVPATECPSAPSAMEPVPPTTPVGGSPGFAATFRVCGTPDPQIARAIEQAVAGRAFSATLIGRPDGCGDLSIQVTSPAALSPGSRVQSTLSLSLQAGRGVSIEIVSEDGATNVSLGPGR